MSCYEYPAKYGNYTFDWKEMNKLIYFDKDNDSVHPVHYQIARLVQQLGLSKNLAMTYGANSSTAHEANVIRTLRNFGFYSGGTHEKYVGSRIAGEVQKGFPVIITAFASPRSRTNTTLGIATTTNPSGLGGHCWLMHGSIIRSRSVYTYNASNVLISEKTETVWYFLCNLGWGGSFDGYYLNGAFDINKGPEYDWDGPSYSQANKVRAGQDAQYNYQYDMAMNLGIRKTNTDWGYE